MGATPYDTTSKSVAILVKGVRLVKVVNMLFGFAIKNQNHPSIDGMVAGDFLAITGDAVSAFLETLVPIGRTGRDD